MVINKCKTCFTLYKKVEHIGLKSHSMHGILLKRVKYMLYDDKKFIGNVIKNSRKKTKLSQSKLSELVGMCDKNLGNIENGKQFPAVNNFLRIIEVLNLSLEDFGIKNSEHKENSRNELVKFILSIPENKCPAFLKVIKTIDENFR